MFKATTNRKNLLVFIKVRKRIRVMADWVFVPPPPKPTKPVWNKEGF